MPAVAGQRTILQRADVPGTNLEITYAPVEIAAGFKAGRHNHPAVVIGHVLGGDFWLVFDGQPEKVLHAGDSFTIPDRAIHTEAVTDKPVKVMGSMCWRRGSHSPPRLLDRLVPSAREQALRSNFSTYCWSVGHAVIE